MTQVLFYNIFYKKEVCMNKTLKKVLIFVVALVFLFVLAILIKGFVDTGSLTFSPILLD